MVTHECRTLMTHMRKDIKFNVDSIWGYLNMSQKPFFLAFGSASSASACLLSILQTVSKLCRFSSIIWCAKASRRFKLPWVASSIARLGSSGCATFGNMDLLKMCRLSPSSALKLSTKALSGAWNKILINGKSLTGSTTPSPPYEFHWSLVIDRTLKPVPIKI